MNQVKLTCHQLATSYPANSLISFQPFPLPLSNHCSFISFVMNGDTQIFKWQYSLLTGESQNIIISCSFSLCKTIHCTLMRINLNTLFCSNKQMINITFLGSNKLSSNEKIVSSSYCKISKDSLHKYHVKPLRIPCSRALLTRNLFFSPTTKFVEFYNF